jgi:hypothetical protein
MTSVYHIVVIHVNETSWAHIWRLHFRYLEPDMTSLQSKGARWPVLFSAFSFSTSDPAQLATELVSAACFISHRQMDSREQVKVWFCLRFHSALL